MAENELIGKITHYYGKIGVAIVELSSKLAVGDMIAVRGTSTNFQQKVESMQIEHINVKEAGAGDSVGLKVEHETREGDKVFKVL